MLNPLPKNKLIEDNNFFNEIKELINEKYSLILRQEKSKNFYIEKYNLFENIRSSKFLFNYLRNYNKKNDIERLFIELLYKVLTDSEKSISGSSFFTFYFILNFLVMNQSKKQKFLEKFYSILDENNFNVPNKTEFELFTKQLFIQKPNWYYQLYKKINELSGIRNQVLLKPSNSSELILETKIGYRFNGSIYPAFFKNGIKTIEINDFKVVLVDGIIESSSEIFNILNYSFETKIPVLLFAQKFSEEVLNIIAANFIRNNVQIYPVELETSLYTLNQITDLSVICDSIPISVLSGESLITKNVKDMPFVEKCILTNTSFIIENKKTRQAVENHIRFLIKRKQEKAEEYKTIEISDYNKLYDSRIEKLLGNVVEVQIPKTWSQSKTSEFTSFFDNILRTTKNYYSHGLANQQLIDLIKDLPLESDLISDKELLLQIIYGVKFATSFTDTLSNVNAVIIQN
jgi:hypothetical protein